MTLPVYWLAEFVPVPMFEDEAVRAGLERLTLARFLRGIVWPFEVCQLVLEWRLLEVNPMLAATKYDIGSCWRLKVSLTGN